MATLANGKEVTPKMIEAMEKWERETEKRTLYNQARREALTLLSKAHPDEYKRILGARKLALGVYSDDNK